MRYYWRIFLWEGGHKTEEYTKYTNAPIFLEDKLDETLDSGEVILTGMPIASKSAFPPKTKFRLERYAKRDFSDTPKTWDMIVEHDDVEEYTGAPSLCTHRVHLIEASAVAQGMHVDNIALTYELQDVDLNYKVTKDDTTILGNSGVKPPTGGSHSPTVACETCEKDVSKIDGSVYTFKNTYKYEWENLDSIKKLFVNLDATKSHHIEFNLPKLICYGCREEGKWSNLFEMNAACFIYRVKYRPTDGAGHQSELVKAYYVGPTYIPECDDDLYKSNGKSVWLTSCFSGDGMEIAYGRNLFRISKFRQHLDSLVSTDATEIASGSLVSFDTIPLTEAEVDAGWKDRYDICFLANPMHISGMIEYYRATVYCRRDHNTSGGAFFELSFVEQDKIQCPKLDTMFEVSFFCTNMSETAEGGPFLMKGVKYSCYDLLQRTLLTLDTQVIDNSKEGLDGLQDRYPIVLSENWAGRLKAAKMQETIFEGKNLWEVLIQIGYYLHAIPYLEFATDGTDRFVLAFRQLGDTRTRADTNTKITVFNSRNLSEYFTQYDSYVTNLFSPQNEVDEWLVPKTSDNTYLVSNNTAELHTSRQIAEITAFDITYNGRTESALAYIFEESVYQILTSDNPQRIKPAKGNAIYYKIGSNVIGGLNYVPPEKNGGTYWLSLQEICRRLFGTDDKLKYNDLSFHVRYRTQDELRLSQIRPDVQNFMRNSSYEKYPHHEQYYGQQDKIIDSERFSANLFGKLIRVGNAVYQRQELVRDYGGEKESGDLVEIGGEAYYVTATENEYYPDVILQKVTYSKNFNQLSNIVTIPSEPRFYEVSERSKIRREVRLMDFLELSTTEPSRAAAPRYLNGATWKAFISALLFNKSQVTLPNFAYTRFSADMARYHVGANNGHVPSERLFPSSEIVRTGENDVQPKGASDHADCISSLLFFPLHDGIVFEWDMEDNFKAGDYIDRDVSGDANGVNEAYMAQQSHRYVDVMGRADLFTFRLFRKTDWTHEQAQKLPMAVITPSESDCIAYLPSPYTIGLDKDNREELSFNYQINLLHRPTEDDAEDFITFPNLFGQKESPLKMCFLNEPQSLFNENVSMTTASVVADDVPYSLIENAEKNAIEVRITEPSGVNLDEVKAIVLYQVDEIGGKYAYIVKNVQKQPNERKLRSWWISPKFSD